ncbi:MAG TPA: xanthine dehydrogenase family protein subunit M [Ktedonobacterales bacterium]|nr:xanthine dehydrogenase family protein subunit M [Ktedonobacterales bacterium]
MRPFEHLTVQASGDAISALAQSDGDTTRLIAGGTDLLPLLKDGLVTVDRLIDIKPARALRHLAFADDGSLHIGALTTLAEIERSAEVGERLPILVQAVADAATPQLRAMATVGGNLLQRSRCWYYRGPFDCWLKGGETCYMRNGENKYAAIFEQGPCRSAHPSDLAPALVALDATVTLESASGARTLPVAEMLAPPTADERIEYRLNSGELLTEIRIPAQSQNAHGVYLKAMDRRAWAFALVSAAAQLTIVDGTVTHARLALGGVANVPWRVTDAEALLEGQPLTLELAAQAAERAVQGASPLAHNGYKVRLARELARRAILMAGDMWPGNG